MSSLSVVVQEPARALIPAVVDAHKTNKSDAMHVAGEERRFCTLVPDTLATGYNDALTLSSSIVRSGHAKVRLAVDSHDHLLAVKVVPVEGAFKAPKLPDARGVSLRTPAHGETKEPIPPAPLNGILREIGMQNRLSKQLPIEHAWMVNGSLYFTMPALQVDLYELSADPYALIRAIPDPADRKRVISALLLQIVQFVKKCHAENVALRDLKLENIMVDKDGMAIPIDFGDATDCAADGRCTGAIGTRGYMAPEVWQRVCTYQRAIDHNVQPKSDSGYDGKAADMWSLGWVIALMHPEVVDALMRQGPDVQCTLSELYTRAVATSDPAAERAVSGVFSALKKVDPDLYTFLRTNMLRLTPEHRVKIDVVEAWLLARQPRADDAIEKEACQRAWGQWQQFVCHHPKVVEQHRIAEQLREYRTDFRVKRQRLEDPSG